MSKNDLSCNNVLLRGDHLVSNNGKFKAVFQEDGNFVIYGWSPIWETGTCGMGTVQMIMQADCNLVMYNGETETDNSVWATATSWRNGTHLCAHARLEDDGTLVVYEGAEVLWKSK